MNTDSFARQSRVKSKSIVQEDRCSNEDDQNTEDFKTDCTVIQNNNSGNVEQLSYQQPFLNFLRDFRRNVKRSNEKHIAKEIVKIAGTKWRELPQEEKKPYILEANSVRNLLKQQKLTENPDTNDKKRKCSDCTVTTKSDKLKTPTDTASSDVSTSENEDEGSTTESGTSVSKTSETESEYQNNDGKHHRDKNIRCDSHGKQKYARTQSCKCCSYAKCSSSDTYSAPYTDVDYTSNSASYTKTSSFTSFSSDSAESTSVTYSCSSN